jgi:hypothetical protein
VTALPLEGVGSLESLGELFNAIRNRIEDLPLVVIVFGWHPSSVADQFGQELREVLAREDRVWWVRVPGTSTLQAAPRPGVLLDPASKLDTRILRNQPAEIVFLSGEREMVTWEEEYLETVGGMPVVVVTPDSPEGRPLAASAIDGGRNLFTINGGRWICVCPDSLFTREG